MIDQDKRDDLVESTLNGYIDQCEAVTAQEGALCAGVLMAVSAKAIASNVGTKKALEILSVVMTRLIEDDPALMAEIKAKGDTGFKV